MKLKVLFFCLLLFCGVSTSSAKGVIVYGNDPVVTKVLDLPINDAFTIVAENGQSYHANLGVMYDEFSLFWVPIWNYGEMKYVLFTDTKIGEYDYTYVDLSAEDVAFLQSQFGGIPTEPELPFWNAIGGKLVLLLLILVIGVFFNKD